MLSDVHLTLFCIIKKKPNLLEIKHDAAMYHIQAGLHLSTAAKFSEELAHWMASSNSCCGYKQSGKCFATG